MSSPAPKRARKVKAEVDDDEEENEDDDDYQDAKGSDHEEASTSDESAAKAKTKTKTKTEKIKPDESKRKGKKLPPTFEEFKKNNGVTLHLVIKDAEGKQLKDVALKKHQYGTGSYGWFLADKTIVDEGELGSLPVSLHSTCEYTGSVLDTISVDADLLSTPSSQASSQAPSRSEEEPSEDIRPSAVL
jgi:hypothetical protein